MNARLFTTGWIIFVIGICMPAYGQNDARGGNVIAYKELEKQLLIELRKPADQRDLGGLLAKLKSAQMPEGSSMASDVANWIRAVEQTMKADMQTKQMLNDLDDSAAKQKEYARRLAELKEEARNPSPIRQTAAEGVLAESNMSNPSPAYPKRYELRDAKTGKVIAMALNADGKIDMDKYLDRQVKIAGPAVYVKEFKMDVIDVTSLTAKDGGRETVTSADFNAGRTAGKTKANTDNADSNNSAGNTVKQENGGKDENVAAAPADRQAADTAKPADQQASVTPVKPPDDNPNRKPLESPYTPPPVDNSRQGVTAANNNSTSTPPADRPPTDQAPAKPPVADTNKPSNASETVVTPVDKPTRLEDLGGGQHKTADNAGTPDKRDLTGDVADPSGTNSAGKKPPPDLKSATNEIEYD